MQLKESHTITTHWTAELETARALYEVGDYEDALRVLAVMMAIPDLDSVNRLGGYLLKACIEWRQQDLARSLETLGMAGPLVDSAPPELRGKYFGQRALAHRGLYQTDAALVDYEQARDCAMETADARTEASIRNNIAVIYNELGRRDEALVEIDAALKTFIRLRDDVNAGYCHDTRAQVLLSAGRYEEARHHSEKALRLLVDDPARVGALRHYGLAMIGIGAGYLDKPESVEQFRARHHAAKLIDAELNRELIQIALSRSGGHVLGAAKLLDVSHSVLIKLIAKYNLERAPKRHRRKSTITK